MNSDIKKFISENKIYEKILKCVIEKYKIYGKVTGSFSLMAKNSLEISMLRNFDTKVFEKGKAKIKCTDVEKLFLQKYEGANFIEILEFVNGKEIITNKKMLENEEIKLKDYFIEVLNEAKTGIGKECFKDVIENKLSLYRNIILKYNEAKGTNSSLEALKRDFKNIIDALNNLPMLEESFEMLPTFAARYSRDSHYFDYGTWRGNFLVKGIEYILSKENTSDIESYNDLLLEAGIYKDTLSNNITIYGFNAEKIEDGVRIEVPQVNSFVEWEEPLQISLSNMLKVDNFIPISDEIYIFENPSILAGLLSKGIKNKAIICTSGQLNLSAHILIKKLTNYKKIYYAGDFDFKGIEIAYKLKEKLKDKLEFLCYTKECYEKIKSENIISTSKIKCLEKYKIEQLKEVIESIEKYKCAGYQELLLDEYIAIINFKI